MARFFVHHSATESTTVFQWDGQSTNTLADVLAAFFATFAWSRDLSSTSGWHLSLVDHPEFGRLADSTSLTILDDLSDIFVIESGKSVVKVSSTKSKAPAAKPINPDHMKLVATGRRLQESGYLAKAALAFRSVLAEDAKHAAATEYLGQVLLESRQLDDAIEMLHAAERIVKPSQKGRVQEALAKAYFYDGEFDKAARYFDLSTQNRSKNSTLSAEDAQVWLARCLYEKGDGQSRQMAVSIVEQVIQTNQNHGWALLVYSRLAADLGQAIPAVPHTLRALVISQQSGDENLKKAVGAHLARVISDGCTAQFLSGMGDASQASEAVGFVATIVKDAGAIHEAAQLFAHAAAKAEFGPQTMNMHLSLIHAQECRFRYDLAWQCSLDALRVAAQKELVVGGLPAARILALVQKIGSDQFKTAGGGGAMATDSTSWTPLNGEIAVTPPITPPHLQSASERDGSASTCKYPDQELDLLAIIFTCVKLLFCRGHLAPIAQIMNLVEPVRRDQQLHLTKIRNEHAYFACIADIVAQMMTAKLAIPTTAQESQEESIFVLGDSHCLPLAWQSVEFQDSTRLLRPMLVTGLKCWHLRPESHFYPKKNFEAAVQSLPQGATVIALFGEIDCREGLVLAVEKNRAESLEKACQESVAIYVSTLEKIARRKKLTILVHPVNSVLDVTRENVVLFNTFLAKAVQHSKSKRLRLLDFGSLLFGQDGTIQDKDFELDGTHLSPTYVRVLQTALNNQ